MSAESDRLRDRYGRHLWGQACLLARRLAVAGAAVLSLYIDTPKTGPEYTNWDDHIQNAGRPGHFGQYLAYPHASDPPYRKKNYKAAMKEIND